MELSELLADLNVEIEAILVENTSLKRTNAELVAALEKIADLGTDVTIAAFARMDFTAIALKRAKEATK